MNYVVREADTPAYEPANHSGTVNRRVIGPENVGATALEVVIGTIEPGAAALPHTHPGIEQVVHVLEGSGEMTVDGQRFRFTTGEWVFLPAGRVHGFEATGESTLRLIVIYGPPYHERPEAAQVVD